MALTAKLPEIRPITDLRTRLSELEQLASETGEPIILTRNGAPSLVLMDSAAYDESLRHQRAVQKLREAEIEAQYVDKTVSLKSLNARMAEILSAARAANA